jgi:hypothetical protein
LTNTRFSSDQYTTEFPYQEFLESSYGEPLINWDKPTPIWKLLKQCRKAAERGEKLLKKFDARRESSISNLKSVPKNAIIRKEYIKCGKEICEQKHGPYYYAYWKDSESKKLKKKYIGDHIPKNKELKNDCNNNNQIL